MRCVTPGEEILSLLETADRSFGRRLRVPLAAGLAMDPTVVGETAKVAARLQRAAKPAISYRYFLSTRVTSPMEASSGAVRKRKARDRK